MTIEEVEELRILEVNKRLRFPKTEIETREIRYVVQIQELIYNLVNNKFFIPRLISKLYLKKMGIKIKGKGTAENPYVIQSKFGEGKCFNINYLFADQKCPFEVGECFANSFNMCCEMKDLPNVKKSDCVSGITLVSEDNYIGGMLHSVMQINNYIADVNLGLVMSKDLYYKIFIFEELARIDGKKAEDMKRILQNGSFVDYSAGIDRDRRERKKLDVYYKLLESEGIKLPEENKEKEAKLSKLYKEQAQLGFSLFLPQVALGHSQAAILDTAQFENDILNLTDILTPPQSSNTMSAKGAPNSGNKTGGVAKEEKKAGRQEKPDDEKSEKTIQNRESMS